MNDRCLDTLISSISLICLISAWTPLHAHGEGALPSESETSHYITVYENNVLKEQKPASEFPEFMRYREKTVKQDNHSVMGKVPVARIEILIIGKDGKPTTSDKAAFIEIHEYAADGTWLGNNIMTRKNSVERGNENVLTGQDVLKPAEESE